MRNNRNNRQPRASASSGSSSVPTTNTNNNQRNQQPSSNSFRLTRYEDMNDLARLFFDRYSELLPNTPPPSRTVAASSSSSTPSPILGLNNLTNNNHQITNHNNTLLNNLNNLNNNSTPISNNNNNTTTATPRRSIIPSQKQQKLSAIEHTLKTPAEWKEALEDMAIILVNMIEDSNMVRLSPESRLALLVSGVGDSQEYLSILPSYQPKASSIHQDRKVKAYIKCKFNDKMMNGELITRGSSKFIEMNIDTLYSKFFPSDNIAKYETQKLIELEVFDGKQTKSFSFNCCKTKSTRNLKRTTIIYGAEEARIKNQILQNEEKVRLSLDRLSNHSTDQPSSDLKVPIPQPTVDVKPTIQNQVPIPTSSNIRHSIPQSIHNPSNSIPQPVHTPQTVSTPRKITRETIGHDGRVTAIITEYYNNDSPKKTIEQAPIVASSSSSSRSNNNTPREVISIEDDVTITPSRKKRKANVVNNTVILIEDEEKPIRSIKPKQEETIATTTRNEPATPKKTISFSSVINLDD